MRRMGFTLVEIMIVVLIIGILLSIAVPQFLKARERSQAKVCIANLRQIEYAKELFAGDARLGMGDPCTSANIWPAYLKGSVFPSCPSGGTYTIDVIGASPTCTEIAGVYPHTLGY